MMPFLWRWDVEAQTCSLQRWQSWLLLLQCVGQLTLETSYEYRL